MKATDFDLSKGIEFDPGKGITRFKDTRLIILDANALGLLRQRILEQNGWAAAQKLFLQFGYQHGFSDFMQMKLNYNFDSQMDLLASGPVLHTWEGIVHAQPKEVRIDHDKDEFFFSGVWSNSYEAEQYLQFNEQAQEPVCWTLMGYASGWSTAFWEKPILTVEPVCVGKGDDHCEWLLKPVQEWGAEAKPYIEALKVFWKGA
jgi:hypothetical protein